MIEIIECEFKVAGRVRVKEEGSAARLFKIGPVGVTMTDGLIRPVDISYNPYKILEHLVEEHLGGNENVVSLVHEESVNEAD